MSDPGNHLLQRLNDGDTQAINEVYTLYFKTLYFYVHKLSASISREEAEDIVSDVFLSLLRQVQAGKVFERADHIRNFLFITARHATINYLQLKQRHAGYHKDFLKTLEPEQGGPDIQRIEAELLELIYNAIESLPAECRRIFKMKYVSGLSYHDIARQLNLKPQTVRNQKTRAVGLLKKHIAKTDDAPAVAGLSLVAPVFACLLIAHKIYFLFFILFLVKPLSCLSYKQ